MELTCSVLILWDHECIMRYTIYLDNSVVIWGTGSLGGTASQAHNMLEHSVSVRVNNTVS